MIDFFQVGKKIIKIRKDNNMTQDDLAKRLFVTRQALSKWENGTCAPSIDSLFELCQLFHVSFDEILCLEDVSLEINEEDIFHGYEREFIIRKVTHNELNVDMIKFLNQLTSIERLQVLKSIKEGQLIIHDWSFKNCLTVAELKFIGGRLANEKSVS